MGKLKRLEKHVAGWLKDNKNETIPEEVRDTYDSVLSTISHVLHTIDRNKYWEAKCRIMESRGFAYANSLNPWSTVEYAESQLIQYQTYNSIIHYMERLEADERA